MYFHGLPGSRLQRHPDEELLHRGGVRLVTIDRPGAGRSSLQEGRTLADWSSTIATLADELGWERFAILGWSGGGPHALACAHGLPDRVTRVGLLAAPEAMTDEAKMEGVAPGGRRLFKLARKRSLWLGVMLWLMSKGARRDPDSVLTRMEAELHASDQEVIRRPDVREMLQQDLRATFAQGHTGFAIEARLHTGAWDFAAEEITQSVHIWHGDEDNNVPFAMGERLAARLPGAQLHECRGMGHFGVLIDRWSEALQVLTS